MKKLTILHCVTIAIALSLASIIGYQQQVAASGLITAPPPPPPISPAWIWAVVIIGAIGAVIAYVYPALCLQIIARKTDTPNGWLAWIPIGNIFLMIMIAGKPLWWFILLLIPLVDIVMGIIIWMSICEKRNKPSWLGILMIIPLANLIIPGYLAFSE